MTFITILLAILFFALIILVHEFGHFITAKMFGVGVKEFAIGMGPAIFKKQGKETLYSIRLIPVGGFCSMEGEDDESENENSFNSKPCLARIVILAAGAAMNLLLGLIICFIVVGMSPNDRIAVPVVSRVVEETYAEGVLQSGDRIVSINGYNINSYDDYNFELSMIKEDNCDVTVERNGDKHTFNIKFSEALDKNGNPYRIIGIVMDTDEKTFGTVIREGFYQSLYMGKLVIRSLRMLISGEVGVDNLSGPVGVVNVMNDSITEGMKEGVGIGILNFLFLGGFIAINIGMMNLLPLPALDGGRILFVLFELIFRRNIPREKEGLIHAIGLILLFGLMLFATWNDIMRFFVS